MKNGSTRKHISLKWNLIWMLLLCWALPVVLLGILSAFLIAHNVSNQVADTVTISANAAEQVCIGQMDSVVVASRSASYDTTIKTAYYNYKNTPGYFNYDMYRSIRSMLVQKYEDNENFIYTVFSFYDDPEDEYMQGVNYLSCSDKFPLVKEYMQYARGQIMNSAAELDTGIGFALIGGQLYMYRNVLTPQFEPIGVLVMSLNRESLFGSMGYLPWSTDVTIWLNDTPTVLSGKEQNPRLLGDLPRGENAEFASQSDASYVSHATRQDGYDFSYMIRVNSSAMLDSLAPFQWLLAAAVLLLIPMLLVAARFFYSNVSNPVDYLMRGVRKLEAGELGALVEANPPNREFQFLVSGFNTMSCRLKSQFDHIYEEELALRDAKIQALQAQINPHFLNNTLEIINWEARIAGNVKASRMIESLSTMMDAALDRKGRPMVHLSEEMMYVNAYLYIISERLGKRLTIEKEVDDGLLDLLVPRLLLQPIIENAVEHGISPRQKGTINIRIQQEGDNAVIEVENDGQMTAEDEARVNMLLSDEYDTGKEGANNIGIRNVHLRLRIIYGESSGLSIQRGKNGNAIARILIPMDGPTNNIQKKPSA